MAQVGQERRAVRDQWNLEELDIASLFQQYDMNNNGTLESDEFHQLLTDYNGGQQPSEDEFTWLMKVADKNHDEMISKSELLLAMQSWYGYTHMENEYSELFEKYDVDHNGHLDVNELTELLTALNDGKRVDPAEAQQVLQYADVMGDGSIGRYELLGAVGIWFISVGRKPTPQMLVALKGLEKQPELSAFSLCVQLAMASMFFWYGYSNLDTTCSKPLAVLLLVSGSIIVAQMFFTIVFFKCCYNNAAIGCMILLLTLASLAVTITGIVFVYQSSGTCDKEFWDICWYLYIIPPIINLSLMCCLCCCLVCLISLSSHDEELQDMNAEQTAPLMKSQAV